MKRPQKSLLSLAKKIFYINLVLVVRILHGQPVIGNFVNNGGFEELSLKGNVNSAKYWIPLQPNKFSYLVWSTSPDDSIPLAPNIPYGFQYPRSGNVFASTQFYCDLSACSQPWKTRGYPRNVLKDRLKKGHKYCVKYYINTSNNSTHATDSFGAYLSDNSIDTINYCNAALVYLTPQVQTQTGFFVTDTLNWTLITGTFAATGEEDNLLLGNFRSQSGTNLVSLSSNAPQWIVTNTYFDDVSVIDIELPAFAGEDRGLIAGDSTYLGRDRDVGIDEACTWYLLPNDSVPIATAAGIWIKSASTATYMVRQDICGNVKRDTVVVYKDFVGLGSNEHLKKITVFPNPASDRIHINGADFGKIKKISINDCMGRVLQTQQFSSTSSDPIPINLTAGAYLITITTDTNASITKKLIVTN